MHSPYTDDVGDQPFASARLHIDLGDIPVIGTNKFAVDYGKVCHSANVENCHAQEVSVGYVGACGQANLDHSRGHFLHLVVEIL